MEIVYTTVKNFNKRTLKEFSENSQQQEIE